MLSTLNLKMNSHRIVEIISNMTIIIRMVIISLKLNDFFVFILIQNSLMQLKTI